MHLNPNQLAAATDPHPRILVIANAGAGKTSTYVERILHLLLSGARPESIVAITFTNAAAAEISKRLTYCDHETQSMKQVPWTLGFTGTLHGFILRLLQKHGTTIGLPNRLTVMSEEEADELTLWCIKRLNFKGPVKQVADAIKRGVRFYRQPSANRPPAELVAYEYYFQMMTTGALDFDSILELGCELVRHQAVSQKLRIYEHWLCDEMQDCSELDFQIMESMPVKTRWLCGDLDQSVFGFRGARPDILLKMLTETE